MFYDQPFSRNWGNTGRGMVPYTLRFVISNVEFPNAINRLDLSKPPTEPADVRSAVYTGTSYVMQYNFNLQSEILPGTGVTLGYMGSQGRKLFRTGNLNIKIPEILPDGRQCFNTSSGARNPACPNAARTRRGNPAWSNIRAQITDANSNYNALVFSVNQRFRSGLRLQSSYTFSKVMSDAETIFGQDFSGGENAVLDPYNPRLDRAQAAFSLTHNFVFNYSYELPLRAEGALGKFIEGWQLSGIINATTGIPFSATSACCSNNGSSGASVIERPDLASGRSNNPVLGGPDKYFDPTAFVNSPAGFYGNVGRNTIIGPGLFTFDSSLLKNTHITERLNLQFRAEFFNLFNRANFDLPANSIFDSSGNRVGNAGRITETATRSREVQLGLKLLF
ncbi:MAG: hypothetical protein HY647_05775 [Acidobacteria bacterium]|nr:hypothetical protein [Acidobacteriota bacterium]